MNAHRSAKSWLGATGLGLAMSLGCSGGTSAIDAGVDGGVDAGFDAGPMPMATSSGAFGVVTVNGKQKLYLPLRETNPSGNGQVAVVDVDGSDGGIKGAPALLATIDLGTTDLATTSAGDSTVVLAAGTNSHNLWVIDPTQDKLVKTVALDPALGMASYSGGGGVVSGIALDLPNHRAVLSVWNGFLYFDLNSLAVTGSVIAAPSENFGVSPSYILAPFYDCSSSQGGNPDAGPNCTGYVVPDGGGIISAGFNLIQLSNNQVFTYENPAASDPTQPLGTPEPDSAAMDISTGLVVITGEGSNESFLDTSRAVFDDAGQTFTAPLVQMSPQTNKNGFAYEGVAVESNSHLAFFEAEETNNVGLVDLAQVGMGADGGLPDTAIVIAQVPNIPGQACTPFTTSGDPHGIAVTTGLQSGTPIGFLVSDDGVGDVWVARIDLASMVRLGQANNGDLTTPAMFAPAVTLLQVTCFEDGGSCDAGI